MKTLLHCTFFIKESFISNLKKFIKKQIYKYFKNEYKSFYFHMYTHVLMQVFIFLVSTSDFFNCNVAVKYLDFFFYCIHKPNV